MSGTKGCKRADESLADKVSAPFKMAERQPVSGNKGECIRTLCRFRPLNAREKALQGGTGTDTAYAMTLGDDGRSVWLGADKSGGQFTLDAMLGPDATQQDAYDQISGIVDSVLQGYNGTLLAYGQVSRDARDSQQSPPR